MEQGRITYDDFFRYTCKIKCRLAPSFPLTLGDQVFWIVETPFSDRLICELTVYEIWLYGKLEKGNIVNIYLANSNISLFMAFSDFDYKDMFYDRKSAEKYLREVLHNGY